MIINTQNESYQHQPRGRAGEEPDGPGLRLGADGRVPGRGGQPAAGGRGRTAAGPGEARLRAAADPRACLRAQGAPRSGGSKQLACCAAVGRQRKAVRTGSRAERAARESRSISSGLRARADAGGFHGSGRGPPLTRCAANHRLRPPQRVRVRLRGAAPHARRLTRSRLARRAGLGTSATSPSGTSAANEPLAQPTSRGGQARWANRPLCVFDPPRSPLQGSRMATRRRTSQRAKPGRAHAARRGSRDSASRDQAGLPADLESGSGVPARRAPAWRARSGPEKRSGESRAARRGPPNRGAARSRSGAETGRPVGRPENSCPLIYSRDKPRTVRKIPNVPSPARTPAAPPGHVTL
jgi:hypothetical protein